MPLVKLIALGTQLRVAPAVIIRTVSPAVTLPLSTRASTCAAVGLLTVFTVAALAISGSSRNMRILVKVGNCNVRGAYDHVVDNLVMVRGGIDFEIQFSPAHRGSPVGLDD